MFYLIMPPPMAFLCLDWGRDQTQGTIPLSYTPNLLYSQLYWGSCIIYFTHLKWPTHFFFLVSSRLISVYKEKKLSLSKFLDVLNNTVVNVFEAIVSIIRELLMFVLFWFWDWIFLCNSGLLWSSLCNPGWPRTWNPLCLNFLSAEFTAMHQHI